ncbi:hypothetical protein NFI96_005628 [Prochilodus magdalenae]|nr:hypothetical protein NFI96_005628 [Prochilodus magdalenae]
MVGLDGTEDEPYDRRRPLACRSADCRSMCFAVADESKPGAMQAQRADGAARGRWGYESLWDVSDGIHRLGRGATVQGMSRSVCGKRSRADVNDWLTGVTEHVGVAKDHSVKEVAESAGVWKRRTVVRVYQQW